MAEKFYHGTLEEKDNTMYQARAIPLILEGFYKQGNPHFAIKQLQDCIDYCDIIKRKAKEGQRFIAKTLSKMYQRRV